MCGIGGCVVADGATPDRPALERMAAAMGHRGPDDHGVELVGGVGLVHTRLAIVGLGPSGHCPMTNADRDWWLTYNGEVFNHADLRSELPDPGWRGGSDTETVLRALEIWGERAVERFNGLFALAALDLRGRRLLLVRDRFGVKPLYVARGEGQLWFASEMGALLAAGVPRRVRVDALSDAVEFGWVGGRAVPLEGIERVLPGTAISVSLDDLSIRETTWFRPGQLVDAERMASLARLPPERIAGEVEEALRQSVRKRLMADVPVGTMCSGGVDSSLVTALAHDEHADIHAFNASVGDQPDWDEGPWAAKVADHLGVTLHTVTMTAESWRDGLVEAVRHVEYPLTHESSVPMAAIAKLARSEGVKVLLSGEGADELFGGYAWLHTREYADFFARRRPVERLARRLYRGYQDRLPQRAGHVQREPVRGRTQDVYEHDLALLDDALAAYDRGSDRRLKALLALDLGTYLPHLLNRQDKTTMQHSVETREPFLDPGLVALALNLSVAARVEPVRKAPLNTLARRLLPPGIAERPKIGFGFSVARYLGETTRPEFLVDGQLRDIFQLSRDVWKGIVDQAYEAPLRLWTGEIWCRSFLGGESAASIESALWR